MPLSLKFILSYLLLVIITSWYSLLVYGFDDIWIDTIYAVIFPLIALGILFRKNIARLVLMAFCAISIVVVASYLTFAIYMQYVTKIDLGQFSYQFLVILAISLFAIILHSIIYLTLRREKIREYFVGH